MFCCFSNVSLTMTITCWALHWISQPWKMLSKNQILFQKNVLEKLNSEMILGKSSHYMVIVIPSGLMCDWYFDFIVGNIVIIFSLEKNLKICRFCRMQKCCINVWIFWFYGQSRNSSFQLRLWSLDFSNLQKFSKYQ